MKDFEVLWFEIIGVFGCFCEVWICVLLIDFMCDDWSCVCVNIVVVVGVGFWCLCVDVGGEFFVVMLNVWCGIDVEIVFMNFGLFSIGGVKVLWVCLFVVVGLVG